MHYTSFEKVSEKMINQLLKDIEVYKSLHSYASCLKENDSDYVPSTFVVNVKKEMSSIATKIDDNLRELREATKEVENMPFILFRNHPLTGYKVSDNCHTKNCIIFECQKLSRIFLNGLYQNLLNINQTQLLPLQLGL